MYGDVVGLQRDRPGRGLIDTVRPMLVMQCNPIGCNRIESNRIECNRIESNRIESNRTGIEPESKKRLMICATLLRTAIGLTTHESRSLSRHGRPRGRRRLLLLDDPKSEVQFRRAVRGFDDQVGVA